MLMNIDSNIPEYYCRVTPLFRPVVYDMKLNSKDYSKVLSSDHINITVYPGRVDMFTPVKRIPNDVIKLDSYTVLLPKPSHVLPELCNVTSY